MIVHLRLPSIALRVNKLKHSTDGNRRTCNGRRFTHKFSVVDVSMSGLDRMPSTRATRQTIVGSMMMAMVLGVRRVGGIRKENGLGILGWMRRLSFMMKRMFRWGFLFSVGNNNNNERFQGDLFECTIMTTCYLRITEPKLADKKGINSKVYTIIHIYIHIYYYIYGYMD